MIKVRHASAVQRQMQNIEKSHLPIVCALPAKEFFEVIHEGI